MAEPQTGRVTVENDVVFVLIGSDADLTMLKDLGVKTEKAKYGERQHSSWETIQRSHAIANGCYVAVPNRTGHEAPDGGDGIEFWGQSFVADPSGMVLEKASAGDEQTLVVEVDLANVETQRTHWPFFRDRRIDAYADMSKRFID